MFSLYYVFVFVVVVVFHFAFDGGTVDLIATFPSHCLLSTVDIHYQT